MCHQTVGLIQKYLEESKIICSTISIIDQLTLKLGTKRFLSVPYDLGFPLGDPYDYATQKNIVKELLKKCL